MEHFVHDMPSLKIAIDALCAFLDGQGVAQERVFDSRLVASELLGNVLKHAKATANLAYAIEDAHVHITVRSSVAFVPPKTSVCSEVYAEHGRGLFLVDSVSVERTVTQNGGILVKIKV